MKIDFTGQTAIVTGGACGLCKSTAVLFAELGANVWIGDVQESEALETVEQIKAMGPNSGFVKTDVSDYQQMKQLVETVVKKEGKLDIMINGAGIAPAPGLMDIEPETAKKVMEINVLGTGYGCRLALEHMLPRKAGKIINFSSQAGRLGMALMSHYAASKAAIISLTQAAAFVGARDGVRVNAICPGIIVTPLWENLFSAFYSQDPKERQAEWQRDLERDIPMGVAQEPIDIAWSVAFLCSDYARYITGQALNVDGGMKMN